MTLVVTVSDSQAVRIIDLVRQIGDKDARSQNERSVWDGVSDDSVLVCTLEHYIKNLEEILRAKLVESDADPIQTSETIYFGADGEGKLELR